MSIGLRVAAFGRWSSATSVQSDLDKLGKVKDFSDGAAIPNCAGKKIDHESP